MIKAYLDLMSGLDNEALSSWFENLLAIYQDGLAASALDVCRYQTQKYFRLFSKKGEDNDEMLLTAADALDAVRRMINFSSKDPGLVSQIENLVVPCLLHHFSHGRGKSTAPHEEALECVILLVFHGCRDKKTISDQLWRLYPHILSLSVTGAGEIDADICFEHLGLVSVALKNYFSADPESIYRIDPREEKGYI